MSLGLVAYGSSDESESSDNEENEVSSTTNSTQKSNAHTAATENKIDTVTERSATVKSDPTKESLPISDDEDDFVPSSTVSNFIPEGGFGLKLPAPKQGVTSPYDSQYHDTITSIGKSRSAGDTVNKPLATTLEDDEIGKRVAAVMTGIDLY